MICEGLLLHVSVLRASKPLFTISYALRSPIRHELRVRWMLTSAMVRGCRRGAGPRPRERATWSAPPPPSPSPAAAQQPDRLVEAGAREDAPRGLEVEAAHLRGVAVQLRDRRRRSRGPTLADTCSSPSYPADDAVAVRYLPDATHTSAGRGCVRSSAQPGTEISLLYECRSGTAP